MKSGFDYDKLLEMNYKLQQVHLSINDIIGKGVGVLARRIVREIKNNSPVDTGHLEASWGYEIQQLGSRWLIIIYNLAMSENGVFYMEFVNDGHRIVMHGKTVGWVEGQFFLDQSIHEYETDYGPRWEKNLSLKIARLILNALS